MSDSVPVPVPVPVANLAAENALLRQVLRNAPAGLAALTGPGHGLTYCNAQFQALAGGRAQRGRGAADSLPELVAQGLAAALDHVAGTGRAWSRREVPLHLLDPVTHQLELGFYDVQLQAARNARGRVQGVTVSAADVTPQVRARQAAAAAEAAQRTFYETLLREVPAGIVAFDAEHRYVFANPVLAQHTGYAGSLLGLTNAEACALRGYSPEVAADRQRRFDEVVRLRAVDTWEETVVSARGELRWLRSMRPVFYPSGALHLMVVSGLDVTGRYHAEALVERQRLLIAHITDAIPNPVYVTDAAGQVTFANDAYRDMMRHTAGRWAQFAQDPARVPEFQQMQALNAAVQASGQEGTLDVACTLDSGEVHFCHVVMRPLPQPNGAVHVLTVSTDVSELKLSQQVATATARAQENFLATMSHEIRTPLNGVLGMADLLAKTVLDAGQRRYVDVVQSAGQHLLAVLNDVLDMAKITAGPVEFEQVPFNLCESMATAVQPLAALAAAKGLAFYGTPLRDSCPHPWVIGDAHRLNQILLNLVSNAVKFTERGSVTVAGEQVRETATAITVCFAVTDTGPGIAPAQQARIFESFVQAHADTARRHGGTGLGLSIARELVAQLGGTLRLSSEVGQGSTFAFTVTLPKAPIPSGGDGATGRYPAAAATAAVRGWQVLLVDDNALNLELAAAVLAQNGVVVDAAASGEVALALFERHRYTAILMDVHMPGMDGLAATARIRAHPDPARSATPVLGLTADAFRAQQAAYVAAGMDGCLTKPFTEAELIGALLGTRPDRPRLANEL